MLAHGGVIGAAGVASGPPAGTLLLGPSDPENFTSTGSYMLGPDRVCYYKNSYSGLSTGNAATARIKVNEDPTGPSYATVALWNSSGTLIAHAEINTVDGGGFYSGAFSSQPAIVSGTTYYLGIFEGAYIPVYTRVSAPSFMLKSFSSSYGNDGSNPTPPSISTGSDSEYGIPEICVQLFS